MRKGGHGKFSVLFYKVYNKVNVELGDWLKIHRPILSGSEINYFLQACSIYMH